MFELPGSRAWLGMVKKRQEFLKIPDPVTKPLSIWVIFIFLQQFMQYTSEYISTSDRQIRKCNSPVVHGAASFTTKKTRIHLGFFKMGSV